MLAGVLCAVDYNEAERIRDHCMSGRDESRRLGFCAAGGRTVPTGVTWDVKTEAWRYDCIYCGRLRGRQGGGTGAGTSGPGRPTRSLVLVTLLCGFSP